jgi:hypothetical protein
MSNQSSGEIRVQWNTVEPGQHVELIDAGRGSVTRQRT